MKTDKKPKLNGWWEIANGLIILLLIVGVFVGANYQYFYKQAGYWWRTNITHQPVKPVEYRTPNTIYLPALEIEAPLVYLEEIGEPAFQAALANGVVHYPNTAGIGEFGNAFFFGHSSDFATKPGNYKTVFALLPHSKIGDEIVVTDDKGKVFKYKVSETMVVGPKDTQWLQQGERKEKMITLQTSYPVGTALKRFLVRGLLEE
jgi:LPXTG-site transpeptidase (sortase) family protein